MDRVLQRAVGNGPFRDCSGSMRSEPSVRPLRQLLPAAAECRPSCPQKPRCSWPLHSPTAAPHPRQHSSRGAGARLQASPSPSQQPAASITSTEALKREYARLRARQMTSPLSTMDNRRLEELHTQLKAAGNWRDILSTFDNLHEEEFSDIDEAAIAEGLFRLGSFYIHLTPKQKAELAGTGLVDALARLSSKHIAELDAEQVTHILDAFGRMKYQPTPQLLEALAQQAGKLLPDFHAHQVPIVLSAFAALDYFPGEELVTALAARAADVSGDITPHDIMLTLWALATLKHRPGEYVLKTLTTYFKHRLEAFRPTEVASVLRACAALQYPLGEDVLRRIAMRSGLSFDSFTGRS